MKSNEPGVKINDSNVELAHINGSIQRSLCGYLFVLFVLCNTFLFLRVEFLMIRHVFLHFLCVKPILDIKATYLFRKRMKI